MAGRHVPERTCVACRRQQPKRALVRIVRTVAGAVIVDLTGKQSGRGAYLCRQPSCWDDGLRKDVIARALKTNVTAADRAALAASAVELLGEVVERPAQSLAEGRRT